MVRLTQTQKAFGVTSVSLSVGRCLLGAQDQEGVSSRSRGGAPGMQVSHVAALCMLL
jgi:hypothetical protein